MDSVTTKLHQGRRIDVADLEILYEVADPVLLGLTSLYQPSERKRKIVYYHEHRYLSIRSLLAGDLNLEDSVARCIRMLLGRLTSKTVELRLVGIPTNGQGFELLLRLLTEIKELWPEMGIRALSAGQLCQFQEDGLGSISALCQMLAAAGLTSLDGRGLRPLKHSKGFSSLGFENWLEVHGLAHESGLRSDGILIYGGNKSNESIKKEMVSIRNLQDKTGGFASLIPLNSCLGQGLDSACDIAEGLRVFTISRIFFDNIGHLRLPWGQLGLNLTQIAMCFGADDLEGSICHRNNSRIGVGHGFRSVNREELNTLAAKAGYDAVERTLDFRAHEPMQQVGVVPDDVSSILYKAESGGELTLQEGLAVVRHAHLTEMGACAGAIKARTNPLGRLSMLEAAVYAYPGVRYTADCIILDLGEESWSDIHAKVLFQELEALRSCCNKIVLRGFRRLLQLSHLDSNFIGSLISLLRYFEQVSLESSVYEVEDDLTTTELRNLHLKFIDFGLKTVPKIELSAPYHGQGGPLWESFLERIGLFRDIYSDSKSIGAIKLQPARGANISPVEFLKAVSLVRIMMLGLEHVIVPIMVFPLFHFPEHWDPRLYLLEVKRLAPLSALFGASDLDEITRLEQSISSFQDELDSSIIEIIARNHLW